MKNKSRFLRKPGSFVDVAWMQEATAKINALLNGKMTNGTVRYGSMNTLWDSGGAGTGQMTYKGEWTESTVAAVQEVYTRGVLGEFICVSVPPAGVAPETGAPYWHAWGYPPNGVWQ